MTVRRHSRIFIVGHPKETRPSDEDTSAVDLHARRHRFPARLRLRCSGHPRRAVRSCATTRVLGNALWLSTNCADGRDDLRVNGAA